ncbi:MAG: homocysteine S-methyltransferase family protein [Spirochaetales bacterium]|nr:homocysteine S-methyltransferase family protein [Spirochaetales bacterium]
MNRNQEILKLAKDKTLVLDGATGTQLQKGGMPPGACPETWCIKNPEILKAVHKHYQDSGANIVYTATLGTNRYKLSEYGETDVRGINQRLAEIARQAVGKEIFVAGNIGPTGRFVEPFGDLPFAEAVSCFKDQAQGLLEGGVDLFVIETMIDIQEARAALLAVKELCDKFTVVTMTYDKSGVTLNGTDPVAALITLQSLGAHAVGCNCSTGPAEMIPLIKKMKPHAYVPLAAKPNAGMPVLENGKTVFRMGPEEFASYTAELVLAGANLVGGCCGTTPEHIKRIKQVVENSHGGAPVKQSLSALSSSRGSLLITADDPLYIIGERINPTGKRKLQQELSEGSFKLVKKMAREQAQNGARLLDVNAGMPGVDEKSLLLELVKLLSVQTDLPLVIDSSSAGAIESCLRLYPGRALINSLSGEKKKLAELLPLIRYYGAMTIVLPVADNTIPHTAGERIRLIKRIVDKAIDAGLTKQDLVIDGLVMAISSQARAAEETLKTIHWCKTSLGCSTVIGLSNISFGMPGRALINSTFLAQAAGFGLTFAIANPAEISIMQSKLAADLLQGKDKDAARFINHFAESQETKPVAETRPLTPEQAVTQALLLGNREEITELLDRALEQSISAEELIHTHMIPAITQVGDLFEAKKYFLPQLIASAETMKLGFAHLQPLLKKKSDKQKGKILLATVEGDIHDIGKNIVALMLSNHGFKVIDLGKDVNAKTIVEKAQKEKPDIIGLSALMTTTMVKMKAVIESARAKHISCSFLLGGAVVTEEYARSLNAHYAKDGVEAVKKVNELTQAR